MAHVRCECGEWSGARCQWEGPRAETVVVEWMPEQHRGSHVQSGNRGRYPLNGASRIRVERSCAERIIECDGEWAKVV